MRMTGPEKLNAALAAAQSYSASALESVRAMVSDGGAVSPALLDTHQRAAHGYAWVETTVHALAALAGWIEALDTDGRLGDAEQRLAALAFGEYLAQLGGGLPMGQNEIVRSADLGVAAQALGLLANPAVAALIAEGNSAENRAAIAAHIRDGGHFAYVEDSDEISQIREQFRRFTSDRIVPNAHQWHLANDLIPDSIVTEMADLGTFGVCIDEAFGGLGLGKIVMCVITEELSRGWIGAGSLGTRSEIAGELIGLGGTDAQKAAWLPRIASGEILPTAVFTEPDVGSDLGSLATRAVRTGEGWEIHGAKNWITHAARSDLMTLLARTNPDVKGHNGLSMMLVPKPRGSEDDPFPADGMTGSEIEVLGYRGMREYALQFDGMTAPKDALLGGEEGQGFKQLMRTFEGARIQTAARAVGVARRAEELALDYAVQRKQFGKALADFPRVSDKIAMMAAETVAARELTYFAAREKDKGRRCDIEAGMAKLLAARVAWSNADAALQIHGGNGYALEYEVSRILCDARILNIFEGAAEIQAQVIARGKLSARN